MVRKNYRITIDATPEEIWEVLWGTESYPKWTSAFSDVSTVQTDWKKGSKVLFMDGNQSGMVSTIDDVTPPTFMSFRHLGWVENGVEDTESEKIQEWKNAMENYTLQSAGGKTELIIDIDLTEPFVEMFDKKWPEALKLVKNYSEKK